MMDILSRLPNLTQRILTSATQGVDIPFFVGLHNPERIDFLGTGESQLTVKRITSPSKDKLETLVDALCHLGNQPGIVFCNFKDSIQRVSDHLTEKGIHHGCFYGGMEQMDRERALVKFRNGTHQLIIATDLAARGLDVPEIKFILHYHLPLRSEEFTHRNGRTARMHSEGSAYVLWWKGEQLPGFIGELEEEFLGDAPVPAAGNYRTLLLSGGRKDKISKGDIAGLFFKQGELSGDELGTIELKSDCAFVAVRSDKLDQVIDKVNGGRIKRKKVKVREV
jgi:superfamily II DNA/RNA helicase